MVHGCEFLQGLYFKTLVYKEDRITTMQIYFNKCPCGWNFPALSSHVKFCPQCKDIIKRCLDCGDEIEGYAHRRICDKCAELQKKIYDKYFTDWRKKKNFKEIESMSDICNYECFNCEYSDCLLPVDKEDLETGNLFKGV
jgi:hypothetical protein